MTMKVSGRAYGFGLGESKRQYVTTVVRVRDLVKHFETEVYNSETGDGVQRVTQKGHVKTLMNAVLTNNFTPTAIGVGLGGREPSIAKNNHFTLELGDGETLTVLDGGHRIEAYRQVFESLKNDNSKQNELDNFLDSWVPVIVYLNGDERIDFLNLNVGRPVDKNHMLSLKYASEMLGGQNTTFRLAYQTARVLYKDNRSPFYKQIKFDSRGLAVIPINTLVSKTDVAASLIGGAKLYIQPDTSYSDEEITRLSEDYAKDIIDLYQFLIDNRSQCFVHGHALCPPPDGTRGGATMLIAVANVVAYRRKINEIRSLYDDEHLQRLLLNSIDAVDWRVQGNFGGPRKRELIHDFTSRFFEDLNPAYASGNVDSDSMLLMHSDIPVALIRLWSSSTFGVSALPKPAKLPKKGKTTGGRRGRKSKNAQPPKSVEDMQAPNENELIGVGASEQNERTDPTDATEGIGQNGRPTTG